MTSSVQLSRNHQNCDTTQTTTNNINNNINTNAYCVGNYCSHYINNNEIAITTLNCSDIGIDVTNYGNNNVSIAKNQSIQSIKANQQMLSSNCVPSMPSKSPSVITIPFGWRREEIDGRVVYYSPTNCALNSLNEIANYLQSEGTCKCGLECPLAINKAFNFDASVQSKPYSIEEAKNNNENKLCNHKRKIIALATYKEHSSQSAALIADQQQQHILQNRLQHKLHDKHDKHNHSETPVFENEFNYSVHHQQQQPQQRQHFPNGDNVCAQPNESITLSGVSNPNVNPSQITVSERIVDAVSVIHANHNVNKLAPALTESAIHCGSAHNSCNVVSHNVNQYRNASEPCIASQHQYIHQATNCENHCHYSVPISTPNTTEVRNSETHSMALQMGSTGAEHMPQQTNSFCLYDNNGNTAGVYSFASCDSTQLSVQQNDNKTSIYLTPQNTANYGQMISYENGNVNLIQGSHSQAFTTNTYSHHFNQSDSGCNTNNVIQSYIPLHSHHSLSSPNSANSGAIAFNASPLSSTAINLNPTYPHSGLHTSHEHSSHQTQNNISILPQNPPMPPISVPNVTTVTTSVTDVIPAVGVAPQLLNSGNPSGAPQVLQFINSVPLTQISANTVTVLQQTPTQEVSSATLLIPQLMQPHEHSMVINHAMAQQTAMFPHIATATSITSLPNAFQNAIGIANAISLPQRSCVPEIGKPFTRPRKRKEYSRTTNRTHPPTVADILKQVADNEKKQKELIYHEKQLKQQQEQQQRQKLLKTANSQTNSQTDESDCTIDSSQTESIRSVAVQSELQSDSENLVNNVCSSSNTQILQSDNECNDTFASVSLTGDNNTIAVLQDIQIESNNEENPISDVSSEHSSPSSECFNGTGSDSGVESEPTGTLLCGNCEEPDSQQVVDSTRQRSLKRLKRLRKELSVYYGNDNSDDESPQSPPLPPQPRTFEVGDLVWGQMGDVRFWPGKLVSDDELIQLSINKEPGKLTVKWFGDHTLTQVEPENLKTLSEGLEEHHCARKRHRSGKRMNSFLEHAIQEAMLELDRQSNDISLSSSSSAVLGVVTSTQTID